MIACALPGCSVGGGCGYQFRVNIVEMQCLPTKRTDISVDFVNKSAEKGNQPCVPVTLMTMFGHVQE